VVVGGVGCGSRRRPTWRVVGVDVPGLLMVLSTESVQLLGPSRMLFTALFDVHFRPKEQGVSRER
jgi:hypothetical protein